MLVTYTKKMKNTKSDKQLIGYICESEDVFQPIFAPIKGQIVTNAFTSCSRCTKIICTRMGPMSNAICLNCFETKEN